MTQSLGLWFPTLSTGKLLWRWNFWNFGMLRRSDSWANSCVRDDTSWSLVGIGIFLSELKGHFPEISNFEWKPPPAQPRFGILFTDTVIGYTSLHNVDTVAEGSMEADLLTHFGSLRLGNLCKWPSCDPVVPAKFVGDPPRTFVFRVWTTWVQASWFAFDPRFAGKGLVGLVLHACITAHG